jgi:DNA-binding transcriptional LysR family regulator
MVLGQSELAVVVGRGHPLAGARATRSALSGHRYLARERGSATEILAPSLLGDAYRKGPVMELGRLEVVRAAVLAGLGYAVMPVGVIASELASGEMVVLPRKGTAVMQVYRAVRRRGLHTPAAAALWEHLQVAASER